MISFIFGEIISSNMLLYNARIFGYDDAEYLLIRNNIIEKIGKGALPSASRKIDLKGSLVLPGFCDSHTHLSNIALMHSELNLVNKNRDEILDLVKKECKNRKMIVGRGWDESFWTKCEYIEKDELDNACSHTPVVLIREDGHMALLNSEAERRFDVRSENGIVKEKDMERVLKNLRISRNLDLDYAQKFALSRGVTCVHDFAGRDTLRAYMAMHRAGRLRLRIYASFYRSAYRYVKFLGLYSGFGDNFLRIGALKLFADGSIGAKTAATKYEDNILVEPMINAKSLRRIVRNANRNGIRVFTHAIGDLAIETVLRAYRGMQENRIEHFELVREEFLDMLNNPISMQPNFLKWAKTGGLYEKMLGTYWLKRNNPYRLILSEGKNLLFGSDCMPLDPLFGIHLAVNSEYDVQRIDINDAIRAYTLGAKYFGQKFGEIQEGNVADLVILKGELKREKIKDLKVEMTIVDGKIMHTSQ